MCLWKAWKRVKTRIANLKRLGLGGQKAYEYANTRKGYWRIAGSAVLSTTVTNQRIKEMGLLEIERYYQKIRNA